MDMYTDNNGFQVIEGTTPFDEDGQFQEEDSLPVAPYQETAAETAWYGGTDGADSLPAEPYQESEMENAWYGGTDGTEELPAATYQETAEYPAAAYQEIAEYGTETYLEEADTLPVEPGQTEMLETEDPGLYQDVVPGPEGADRGQEEILPAAGEPRQTAGSEMDETGQTAGSEADGPEQSEDPETAETETATAVFGEDDEEKKRAEHEAAEARRKAEWEERQQAKKTAEQEKLDQLAVMSDDEAVSAAMKRVGADTEKLTRRNMKDCVAEYIQTRCLEDPELARMVMHPRKSMVNCFHYINRKAKEFIEREMENNDIKPENGVYGSDVPDDLCYQWAEDYFRDPDAKEDEVKEEKFDPKPYAGKSGSKTSPKGKAKKSAGKKEKPKQQEKKAVRSNPVADGQLSLFGQEDDIPEVKAG